MSERKPCVRCGRAIDAWSKSCPFCNWDQARSAASAAAEPEPVIDYRPPSEGLGKKRILMGVGGILLLVASFGIGTVINSDGTPKNAPPTVEEQAAALADAPAVRPAMRAKTQLVPMGGDPLQQQQPITTAPAAVPQGGVPTEYARHDATAVSSEEYRALAQRVAEEEKRDTSGVVDPRSITGRAYTPPPVPAAPRRTAPATPARSTQAPVAAVKSTRPIPEYQPVPDVRVSRSTTVRLQLIVGSNGRVKEVSIRDTVPGQTPKIISAVQRWRFKPATSNGVPVEAPYNVEIWFKND